jgi:hypothetical protein
MPGSGCPDGVLPPAHPLPDCPDGLADWLEMFGGGLTAEVPAALLPRVLARVNELAAPRLRRGGDWFADYWRLRFMAVADPVATGPGVEYPPGRRRGRSDLLR